ncbi:MAG TPA: VWA domain-containing protein [Methylibium sp.]|uniref:VWA domain-containing protein n=1 Tax=Methylibium sp. TaxID=2067992 RepID=UPI002DB5B7F5|nr:VWA domain-containing protein [Methylibium sp.]HEU4460251.1 VWA domain-containing protein [Methylibium sp.]
MKMPIFLWPEFLWGLLLLPALVLVYWLLLKRRKRVALQLASLSLVKQAAAGRSPWRQHLPPLLFLVATALLLLSLARPQAVLRLPSQQQTVILAMDVSGSMRATDVQPSRLEAMQAAARAFVEEQPPYTRIGVVAFAGTAYLVQPPTRSREDVIAAIDRFQLQRGTATGSGLIVSLATLFPDAGYSVDAIQAGADGGTRSAPLGMKPPEGVDPRNGQNPGAMKPVPAGSYHEGVVILLSDGQRTTGPDPLTAAKIAADRGVRVYTVGVGTKEGGVIAFEGWSVHVKLDEDTLKSIATMTQGEYFFAGTAMDLKKVYETLNTRLVFETRQTEVTAFVAALALAVLLLSAGLSLWWFHRVV